MVKTTLISMKDNKELENHAGYNGHQVLGTTTYAQAHGHFNSEISTDNDTIIMIPARSNDAFSLTDIVIVTSKTNGGTVTLSITDGTYTEVLVSGTFTEAPLRINHAIGGRWESWKACRLDLASDSTAGNHTVSCTVGYFRIPEALAREYTAWDYDR